MNPTFDTSLILAWCEGHRNALRQWIGALEANASDDLVGVLAEGRQQLSELDALLVRMRPADFNARTLS